MVNVLTSLTLIGQYISPWPIYIQSVNNVLAIPYNMSIGSGKTNVPQMLTQYRYCSCAARLPWFQCLSNRDTVVFPINIILATVQHSMSPNHLTVNRVVVLVLKWQWSSPWADEVWLILNNQLTIEISTQNGEHLGQQYIHTKWVICSERPRKSDLVYIYKLVENI